MNMDSYGDEDIDAIINGGLMNENSMDNSNSQVLDENQDEKKNESSSDTNELGTNRRKKIRLTPELLISENGVKKLIESSKNLQLYSSYPSENVEGKEHIYSRKLLEFFDDWARMLCPSVNPDEFFLRAEKVAKSFVVKYHIDEVLHKMENAVE